MHDVLERLSDAMPSPVSTPQNARYRAAERKFGHGYGEVEWSSKHMKISARKLMEVLPVGRLWLDFNSSYDFAAPGQFDGTKMMNPFERALAEGRLPIRMSVEIGSDQDDDNIVTVQFGGIRRFD